MCLPCLEPSPPQKSRSKHRPVSSTNVGIIGAHGTNNAQQRLIHDPRHGSSHGMYYEQQRITQNPWQAYYQGLTWPIVDRPFTGCGGYATERQPYMPTQEMVYAIPYERSSLSRTSSVDRTIQHPRDAQIYIWDGRKGRYHVNEDQLVAVLIGRSRGRARSRSGRRSRRSCHHGRTSPMYPHRRRDSSSIDVYLRRSRSLPYRRRRSF